MTTSQFSSTEPSVTRLAQIKPVLNGLEPPQTIRKTPQTTTFVTDQNFDHRTLCVSVTNPKVETVTNDSIEAVSWKQFSTATIEEKALLISDENIVVEAPEKWVETLTLALKTFNKTADTTELYDNFKYHQKNSGQITEYTNVPKVDAPSFHSRGNIQLTKLKPGKVYLDGAEGAATIFVPHPTKEAYKWSIEEVTVEKKNRNRIKLLPPDQRTRISKESLEQYQKSSLIWVQDDTDLESVRNHTKAFAELAADPFNTYRAEHKQVIVHNETLERNQKLRITALKLGDIFHRTKATLS